MSSLIVKKADVYIASQVDTIAIVEEDSNGLVKFHNKTLLNKIILDQDKKFPDNVADILIAIYNLCLEQEFNILFKYDKKKELFDVIEENFGNIGSIVYDRERYILTFYSETIPIEIIDYTANFVREVLKCECFVGLDFVKEDLNVKEVPSKNTNEEEPESKIPESSNPEGLLNIELLKEDEK